MACRATSSSAPWVALSAVVLFPQLGFLLGGGLLGHIVNGVVGAVIGVFASRYVKQAA